MHRRTTRRAVLVALVGLAALVLTSCSGAGSGTGSLAHGRVAGSSTAGAAGGGDYLALGDSVSFGFREADSRPAPDYDRASDFVGFPELVAAKLNLRLANASCPGETSASLIDDHAPNNGCERTARGHPGYRTHEPLHVHYEGSQLAFGLHYLRTNPSTRLVTLMIGANDAFRCGIVTADHCLSEYPRVLSGLTRNVRDIVRGIRDTAHYRGRLVLVSYYSLGSASIVGAATAELNAAMTAGARGFGVIEADGFTAFQKAAAAHGGDDCRAGLLTRLTSGGCGVHPSARGARVLGAAVEQAARR